VAFVGVLSLLGLLGLVWKPAWAGLAALLGLYAMAALASALPVSGGSLRQALGVAWACGCMHVGYGLGFARGLLDFAVLRRAPGAAATRLTR
jgi:hypothetical protein